MIWRRRPSRVRAAVTAAAAGEPELSRDALTARAGSAREQRSWPAGRAPRMARVMASRAGERPHMEVLAGKLPQGRLLAPEPTSALADRPFPPRLLRIDFKRPIDFHAIAIAQARIHPRLAGEYSDLHVVERTLRSCRAEAGSRDGVGDRCTRGKFHFAQERMSRFGENDADTDAVRHVRDWLRRRSRRPCGRPVSGNRRKARDR